MNDLQKLKINNIEYKIAHLKKVKQYEQYCKDALLEYESLRKENSTRKNWLRKHFEVGYLLGEVLYAGDFFNDETQFLSGNLEILDETVYGFSITIPRKYFEAQLNLKIKFEKLFYDEQIYPEKLEEIMNFRQNQIEPF